MYLAIPSVENSSRFRIYSKTIIYRQSCAKLQLTDFIECKDIEYINWRRGFPQGNGSLTSFYIIPIQRPHIDCVFRKNGT